MAADGPRPHVSTDAERCTQTRNAATAVDWPCDVSVRFQDANLGCRNAVSSAIDWFFDNVEEGIIIEDDCLPDPTFFQYCAELLVYYRNDSRVMHIGGFNHLGKITDSTAAYHFSRYSHVWGWATWRRAWQHYDVALSRWTDISRSGRIRQMFPNPVEQRFRRALYDDLYRQRVDTWDYQWNFAVRAENGLSIRPNRNLVVNLGFGPDATHTAGKKPAKVSDRSHAASFPLIHPSEQRYADEVDRQIFNRFIKPPMSIRIKQALRRWIRYQ